MSIFPINRYSDSSGACEVALNAAKKALLDLQALNQQYAEQGEPPIRFGICLHVGQVMYGNIGTKERIDFTVIGRAANEAARIEEKCKKLKEPVLVSDTFASYLGGEWRSQGFHQLRNIGRPIEILSPGDWL